MTKTPLDILQELDKVFKNIGIPYLLTGSFASSYYGMPRNTADMDIIAQIAPKQISDLVKALNSSFYIDELELEKAVKNKSSINIIHFESVLKIDIFISKTDEYSKETMNRGKEEKLTDSPSRKISIISPEDSLLSKLKWYDLGGRVSQKQFEDMQGILKKQKTGLDFTYLKYWASNFGLSKLLEEIIKASE